MGNGPFERTTRKWFQPLQGLAGRATLRSQRMGNRAKVGSGVIEPGLSSASALARDCQEQP